MKTTRQATMLLSCLLLGNAVFAQHTLTYDKKSPAVDTVVTIYGQDHVIARMPVTEIASGDRYMIVLAAPTVGGVYASAYVNTTHSSAAFTPNTEIDGYPAQVQVSDGIAYSLTGEMFSGYDFVASGTATVIVQIKIGETLITVTRTFSAVDKGTGVPPLTSANTGSSANALPVAQWWRYVDQQQVINGLDVWIDYIRVMPL